MSGLGKLMISRRGRGVVVDQRPLGTPLPSDVARYESIRRGVGVTATEMQLQGLGDWVSGIVQVATAFNDYEQDRRTRGREERRRDVEDARYRKQGLLPPKRGTPRGCLSPAPI